VPSDIVRRASEVNPITTASELLSAIAMLPLGAGQRDIPAVVAAINRSRGQKVLTVDGAKDIISSRAWILATNGVSLFETHRIELIEYRARDMARVDRWHFSHSEVPRAQCPHQIESAWHALRMLIRPCFATVLAQIDLLDTDPLVRLPAYDQLFGSICQDGSILSLMSAGDKRGFIRFYTVLDFLKGAIENVFLIASPGVPEAIASPAEQDFAVINFDWRMQADHIRHFTERIGTKLYGCKHPQQLKKSGLTRRFPNGLGSYFALAHPLFAKAELTSFIQAVWARSVCSVDGGPESLSFPMAVCILEGMLFNMAPGAWRYPQNILGPLLGTTLQSTGIKKILQLLGHATSTQKINSKLRRNLKEEFRVVAPILRDAGMHGCVLGSDNFSFSKGNKGMYSKGQNKSEDKYKIITTNCVKRLEIRDSDETPTVMDGVSLWDNKIRDDTKARVAAARPFDLFMGPN